VLDGKFGDVPDAIGTARLSSVTFLFAQLAVYADEAPQILSRCHINLAMDVEEDGMGIMS